MLDTFRQAKSVLGYIFFGMVIVVFALSFGPGSSGLRGEGAAPGAVYAAYVNGQLISESEFQTAYSNLYSYMRQQSGEAYDAERAKQDNLKRAALMQLVDQELLAQAAAAHGVYVSDQELKATIAGDPSFQINGAFDYGGYEKFLKYQLGISPAKYEERVRRRLLAGKVRDLLLGSAVVSEDEIRAEFLAENEKSQLGYVSFTPAMFKDQAQPTPAEIEKYLAEQAAKVQQHYDQTRYLYAEPRSALSRRILFQVPPGGDEAAAKKRADEAYAELTAGKDFGEVAKKYSDDSLSKGKGGEIGWVAAGRSAFGRTLEEEAGKLEKGQMSQVFKDRLGFQILKVEEVKPPSQKSFDEVKSDVARELLKDEKAGELARKKAADALAKARTAADLKRAFPAAADKPETPTLGAAPRKPEYRQTDPFSPSEGSIPGLGAAGEVARLAFSLSKEKPVAAEPVEEHGAFFAVALVDRTRADLEKLEAEKEKWKEQAQRRKQIELYQKLVEALRSKARIDENPAVVMYAEDAR